MHVDPAAHVVGPEYPLPPHCPYLATVPPLPVLVLAGALVEVVFGVEVDVAAFEVVLVTNVVVILEVVLDVANFEVVLAGSVCDTLPVPEYNAGPGIG